jgi:uncharacterized protein
LSFFGFLVSLLPLSLLPMEHLLVASETVARGGRARPAHGVRRGACEDGARRRPEGVPVRLRPVLAAACAAVALTASLASAVPAAAAATPAAAGVAKPDCTGLPKHTKFPVVDAANVVPPEDEAYLIADLMRYQIAERTAIVAATVPELGGDDVSAYARRLFDCWGIGDAARDDGVLVLIAMRERRVRIEAGAGLEDRLSEESLEEAIDAMVAPLRAGDVGGGLRAAAESVAETLGGALPDTKNNPTGGALPRIPGMPAVPARPSAPADVVDVVDDVPPAGGYSYPVSPYGVDGGSRAGGAGMFGLVFLLIVVVSVVGIVRRVIGGVSSFGGASSWSGGYGGYSRGMWGGPSLLRGGSWLGGGSDSDSDSGSHWGSSGSSSSFGSSGSFGGSSGGSSGGSFGGGSSGGGGASGSW